MDPIVLVLWMILGTIIGWLAHLAQQSSNEQEFVFDLVMGAIGAVVGGFLYVIICQPGAPAGFSTGSLFASAISSVVFLAIRTLFKTGPNL